MSISARPILIALCAAAALSGARAQAATTLKPSLSGEFRYDSSADPGSAEPGEDYIVALSPQLELADERESARLNALYRFTASRYLKEGGRDSDSHQAGAGVEAELSERTQARLAYDYRFTEESREAVLTNIQTQRGGIQSHRLTAGASHAVTPRTGVALGASESLLEFSDPALVDTRTDAASVTVNYRMSDNMTISPGYAFSNTDFDTGAAIRSHTASAGAAYRWSPTLDLNASAGLVWSDGAGEGSVDWQAGAGLVRTLPRGTFSASYARSASNSSGLTDRLNINDTFSATLSRVLSGRLNVSLSAAYAINRTRPESAVDMRSFSAGLNAGWQARQWLTVGAGYSYFNQDSRGGAGIDIERNIISVNFTIAPYEYRN